jgi:hypothetical protein
VDKSIIEKQHGISREWVFPYNGTAMHRMRVHDLKHTFGHYSGHGQES